MAWFRAFYYRSFDHSWFISFGKGVFDQYIQSWFFDWWTYFRFNSDLLPSSAVPGFQLLMKQPKSFKALNEIIFSIEFEVP